MRALRERLVACAEAALPRQREDGSFPAGRNGPYADGDTPVRNTGHWLLTLCAAWRWTDDARFADAARAAAHYLASDKTRPGGASFAHRETVGLDGCNGLIGQAWSLEALVEATETFDAPHLAELAETVFLAHPFDRASGLWYRLEVDGRVLAPDLTFNHQLWFAAAGALLAPLATPEVAARVSLFLDRLPRNLALRSSGCIRHYVAISGAARVVPRLALRLLRMRLREGPEALQKEAGYHAFNLYAFALLRRHAPDHAFWRSRRFERLWSYARGGEHRSALTDNPYAWPYNPTGIEMAFALETFEGPSARREAEAWLAEQLERHWEADSTGLRRDTPDPETLAARVYEAVRLPDLALPAPS